MLQGKERKDWKKEMKRSTSDNEPCILCVSNALPCFSGRQMYTELVSDDINHDVHSSLVHGIDKVSESLFATEQRIDSVDILGGIAMVGVGLVQHHGRDPDGVGTQRLDVIQVCRDAREGATAVLVQVVARRSAARWGLRETVRQQLVDHARLPLLFRSGGGRGSAQAAHVQYGH